MRRKTYILTRRDLSTSQQTVQASHAMAELVLKGCPNPTGQWDDPWGKWEFPSTLVVLGVQDEAELLNWRDRIVGQKVDGWETLRDFREPDTGNDMTAFAFVSTGSGLESLPLL